jgi:hypothetical protein
VKNANEAKRQEAEAKKQTQVAVAATEETSEVASRGNVSLARYSEESSKNAEALAHLAQALRLNPENREATGFTASMLTQLSWHIPLTGPMRHAARVNSAELSPDGQRVVTASDNTARLWDVRIMTDKDTTEDILLLVELTEATGGVTLETVGQAENLRVLAAEQVRASSQKIVAKFLGRPSKLTPLQRFLKWSVSDRRTRTISPFLQVTGPEWLENRI